ncbi:LPXTG cell wall anchor domain-containing protein [Paenilisteria rocourtiae]
MTLPSAGDTNPPYGIALGTLLVAMGSILWSKRKKY